MTEITPSTSSIAKAATSVRAPGHAVSGRFASALALLLPGQGEVEGVEARAGDPRQALAGTGKDLPEGKPADGSDLLWLPFGLQLPQTPVATPIVPPQTGAAVPVDGEAEAQPIILPAAIQTGLTDKLAKTVQDQLVTTEQPAQAKIDAQPAKFELPADIAATATRTAAPAVQQLQLQVQAAPTIVAQALATAQPLETGATLRRAQHDSDAPLTVTAPATEAVRPTAVTATGDGQQSTLDMRRDTWMGSMIDHIEALRDHADANDTRIRVIPDALGTIDVSIRKDADRVHVHFAAEAQATRTLLNDAAPKLAELADARGLRLGDTSVGTGSGQAQGGRQDVPRAPLPTAPAGASNESEIITDTRIA